jgi:hypothetical protein
MVKPVPGHISRTSFHQSHGRGDRAPTSHAARSLDPRVSQVAAQRLSRPTHDEGRRAAELRAKLAAKLAARKQEEDDSIPVRGSGVQTPSKKSEGSEGQKAQAPKGSSNQNSHIPCIVVSKPVRTGGTFDDSYEGSELLRPAKRVKLTKE